MQKEILLYGDIYSGSVARFIDAMNEVSNQESLVIRLNTNGGNPEDMTGLIAKLQEYKGDLKIKVDGKAYSSGAFFLMYAKSENIEATDVSKAMIHRAAYPSWMEDDKSIMTAERWAYLDGVNANLRKALEAKIDSESFKSVTGKTYDEIFSNDSRIDVFLDAKQMKKLGLIGKINTITPKRQSEISSMYDNIAAQFQGVKIEAIVETNKPLEMDLEQLKKDNQAEIAKAIEAEKDRVGAWMAYIDIDAKRVKDGIASGKPLSMTDMAELNLKALASKEVKAIEADSPKTVETPKDEPKDEPKAVDEFEKLLQERRNSKNK